MVRKIAVTSLIVAAVVVARWAGAAVAHVTVDPPSAPQGGTVKLSFLAPNEEPSETVTAYRSSSRFRPRRPSRP